MLIQRAYRFRVYPDAQQALQFDQWAGCTRLVWNLALEQRQIAWRQHRITLRAKDQSPELPDFKRAYPWAKEAPAQCYQQALAQLDKAYDDFFAGTHGFPTRRKKFVHDSFKITGQKSFKVRPRSLWITKAGWLRLGLGNNVHQVQGRATSVTLKREGGFWYASIQTEREVPDPAPIESAPIGLDRGVAVTVMDSDGHALQALTFTEQEHRKYRQLKKAVSRTQKGSRNRHKARARIRRFLHKHKRRQLDRIHKFTYHLAKNHSRVVIEDLRIRNMTRSARGTAAEPGRRVRQKAGLNRAILEQCWGEIARQLEYKCQWYGSRLVKVPPQYTSQTCSQCGHVHEDNRVSQAVFRCLKCQFGANADHNAAMVILAAGVAV